MSLRVMRQIAKAWTFEAKAINFGLGAKAWPRGLHHWDIYTSN